MQTITERMQSVPNSNFVCMGILRDGPLTNYACLVDISTGNLYAERMVNSAILDKTNLYQIEDEKEWAAVMNYITSKTTIFSPNRLKKAVSAKVLEQILHGEKLKYPYVERNVKGVAVPKAPPQP